MLLPSPETNYLNGFQIDEANKSYHRQLVIWMIPHVVHALVWDEEGDQYRELYMVKLSQTFEWANVLVF